MSTVGDIIDSSEVPSRTMAWSKIGLLGLAATFLAGCRGAAIPPASTQEELRAECIRDGGRWMPDDSRSGYCKYEM